MCVLEFQMTKNKPAANGLLQGVEKHNIAYQKKHVCSFIYSHDQQEIKSRLALIFLTSHFEK